jgi:predicted DNA-binding protein YlxM (UPF0122 family)
VLGRAFGTNLWNTKFPSRIPKAKHHFDVEYASTQSGLALHDAIIEEMNSLTRNQKDAVELRYMKKMSFNEIAVRMHSSPHNIRQLFSRGIRELRLKLSKRSKLETKTKPQKWQAEFTEFLNVPSLRPPAHVTDEILGFVRRDLNPNIKIIMVKLLGIHLIFGSVSLLVCFQVGMGTDTNMTHYFTRAGEHGCIAP